MSYSGCGLLIAAELLQNDKNWRPDDKQKFIDWLKNVYQPSTGKLYYRDNNTGDWSRYASLIASSILKDTADINATVKIIKENLLNHIASDGHLIEEVKRERKGLWYTYFSLAPKTTSIWAIYNITGENLFEQNRDEISLKKSLDYLFYYTNYPKEWKWFNNIEVADATTYPGFWPVNLFDAMQYIYSDSNYNNYILPLRPIILNKHHFAWTFPSLMPVKINYN